jgi:hypothetical protein
MPRKKKKTEAPDGASIAEQLLQTLEQAVGAEDNEYGNASRNITKRQALVESIINEALKGDQRMIAALLKLIEKHEDIQAAKKLESTKDSVSMHAHDWEILFAFFGKYKDLIEQEIEKRKSENPRYWSFDWYQPELESAPWYKDLYG